MVDFKLEQRQLKIAGVSALVAFFLTQEIRIAGFVALASFLASVVFKS